jgi:hypothetical protein
MLYRERASTRHLFGRSTRVPPSPSRGQTSARHTEVAVMLQHLPHFCNSLFTSPRMRWPEHGAYDAAGLWRRATAWSARPACLPPWHTRRIPHCRPQHAASAVDGRVPTSARHGRRAPWQAPRAPADRRRVPWGVPRPSLAAPQTLHRHLGWSDTGCVPTGAIPWSVGGGWEMAGDRSDGHAAHQETGCRLYVGCAPSWARKERQALTRTRCVPTGDQGAYLRETRVRTYGRPGAYLRETGCVPTGDRVRTYGRRISL